MSSSLPSNSLDDIDYDEMEDVSGIFERCHIDGNRDTCHGDVGDTMSIDEEEDDDDYSDLPSVLIITGVPDVVYNSRMQRDEFESMFRVFEPTPEFFYLRSFRRVRVSYESSGAATMARIQLHGRPFYGSILKCYFAQIPDRNVPCSSSPFLLPPKPDKQFLISPPSSPPVGWESMTEKDPVINYDLLAAITNLAPGQSHELHAASDRLPGIVVHVCEDPEGFRQHP